MKISDRFRLLTAAFSTGDSYEKGVRLAQQEPFWDAFFGRHSSSGKPVQLNDALAIPAFFATVRATSQIIAGMGFKFYEKTGTNSRERLKAGDLVDVLELSPNRDQTPFEFWECMVAWMVTQGNAYALKEMVGDRLSSLLPLPSSMVEPKRDPDTGELEYHFSDRGHLEILPRKKILHIKGFGFGGDKGLSAIRYGLNSIGSSISTDETAAKMFASGMSASGVLSTDTILNPDQRAKYSKMLAAYSGSENAGKMMVLEGGTKYIPLTLNPEDAQMLETRRFNIEEICRWTGTPPIIIGHSPQGQTMWGTGVEQIMIAWQQQGLNPLARRIEQSVAKHLIRPPDRNRIYGEFNRESLIQMDSAAKAAFLSTMTQNAIMTRNEARQKLNLPRIDGADELTAQTALAPLDSLGNSDGSD